MAVQFATFCHAARGHVGRPKSEIGAFPSLAPWCGGCVVWVVPVIASGLESNRGAKAGRCGGSGDRGRNWAPVSAAMRGRWVADYNVAGSGAMRCIRCLRVGGSLPVASTVPVIEPVSTD